jgi:Dienelactone hydrolase and related enzymes
MLKYIRLTLSLLIVTYLLYPDSSRSEPIKHEISYPDGNGPFPAVITLHTSGGFYATKKWIKNFSSKAWTNAGYVVYAPDFFTRHGLTPKTRMETFSTYRVKIERELSEIVQLAKNNPKVDHKNIFAVGFSNGGFWASFLAGTGKITAGASHYGVWKGNMGREITNPYPMKYFSEKSSPMLALHGEDDGTQKMLFVEDAWDRIKNNGGKLATHVYPGTDHAWDSKSKRFDAWNPEVKEDSMKRTLALISKYMQ